MMGDANEKESLQRVVDALADQLERAEYIRKQQVQHIQKIESMNANFKEQISALVKEKYRLLGKLNDKTN